MPDPDHTHSTTHPPTHSKPDFYFSHPLKTALTHFHELRHLDLGLLLGPGCHHLGFLALPLHLLRLRRDALVGPAPYLSELDRALLASYR